MGTDPNIIPSGILLVLSAPLGVGKRTLCQALLDRHPEARLSISKTTRPRGPREVEGYDFNFISEADFKKQIETREFLEYVVFIKLPIQVLIRQMFLLMQPNWPNFMVVTKF